MLKLRLQRTGRKGYAQYRIVVTEHTAPAKSGSLELIGSYDPHSKKIIIKEDRLNYWISNGAKPSATLNNLLVKEGVIKGDKMVSWKPKKKEITDKPAVAVKSSMEKAEEPKEESKEEAAEEVTEETVTENKEEESKSEEPAEKGE